jgi:hypothetical protein
MREIRQHRGIVWRDVVSLHEDDAARLGYTTREAWENVLRSAMPDIAEAMGIREDNLRWVAAFHQKTGHPHCHISFWEQNPERSRGVITNDQRRDMRKAFMDVIYENERAKLYLEKNTIRDLLRDQVGQELRGLGLRRYLREITLGAELEAGGRPGLIPALDDKIRGELQTRLEEIARAMPGHGRIALQYMPPGVKEKVQETADWLLRQPGFVGQAGRYREIAVELATTYTKNEESFNRARENAYNDVRDRVSQVLLKGAAEVQKNEKRWLIVELGQEHVGKGHSTGQRSAAGVARDVWQGAFRAVERERQKAEARGKLAKMKELKKQEIREQQHQQGHYQDRDDGYER